MGVPIHGSTPAHLPPFMLDHDPKDSSGPGLFQGLAYVLAIYAACAALWACLAFWPGDEPTNPAASPVEHLESPR